MDPDCPEATTIAIEAGRIAAVGGQEVARDRPGVRCIDLDGAVVVPGLEDAHLHLASMGARVAQLDLTGCASARDAARRVARRARTLPRGRWLLGRGWNHAIWPGGALPDRELLDRAAPGRPVVLTRVDGHAAWVSSCALERARLGSSTPDPPGGRIVRDVAGRPSGVLIDRAMDAALDLVPPPDPRMLERALELAQAECLAAGLTRVHDAGLEPAALAAIERLYGRGVLRLRIYGMLFGADHAREHYRLGPRIDLHGGRLTVRTVKLMADGALGSGGAALLRDYHDQPGHSGLLLLSATQISRLTAEATRAGFQVATHAIGDRAVRATLEGYAQVPARARLGFLRPRIEHAQIVDPADLPRIRSLRLVASIQPIHAPSDRLMALARLDRRAIDSSYPWRALHDAGACLAGGSDAPVEDVSPLAGIHAARGRMDGEGRPRGGWRARERLSGIAALALYTTGPAYASFCEHRRGRIARGFDADLTILSDDPTCRPIASILSLSVLGTFVAGECLGGSMRVAF